MDGLVCQLVRGQGAGGHNDSAGTCAYASNGLSIAIDRPGNVRLGGVRAAFIERESETAPPLVTQVV